MEKIHAGHQGIVHCRLRVAESVWWLGVSKEIETFIQSCPSTLAIYIAELSMGEIDNGFVRVGQGDVRSCSRLLFEVYRSSLVPRPSSRAVDPLPQKLSERKAW